MTIIRSGLVVLAGYAVFAISAVLLFHLAGRDPHAPQSIGFVLFTVLYGIAFAGAGGLVAAWLARSRQLVHATGVAGLIAVGATVSLLTSPGAGATWSQWAALVLMAPSAWVAAAIRGSRRQRS